MKSRRSGPGNTIFEPQGDTVVAHSATLAINELVQSRRAAGANIIHLGFGEAGLPVAGCLLETLRDAAGHNGYGPVGGTLAARQAAAAYFSKRGLVTDPDQVLFGPGSKSLLFGLMMATPGDVILPQPSWVTYAAQVALLGRRVIPAGIGPAAGGVPDPEALTTAIRRAKQDGLDPRILILTLPDNPTGTMADAATVKQVCEVAEEYDLTIISDEIYRDLAYDASTFVSPATLLPERTTVTSGLSKSLALGGWRIGFARLPDNEWGRNRRTALVGVASEIWSSMPSPMHDVAAFALNEPPEISEYVRASARLHETVATEVYEIFARQGFPCRKPTAAFYLYPDLEILRPALAKRGVETGLDLATHLLDQYGIGVLPGVEFGDSPNAFRVRVATSLLYGQGKQRQEALDSNDPLQLPWIAESLDTVRHALDSVASQ